MAFLNLLLNFFLHIWDPILRARKVHIYFRFLRRFFEILKLKLSSKQEGKKISPS